MSVVISVRVPKWLKDECKKLGINVSDIMRRALEEEVRRRKEKLLKKAAGMVGEVLSKLSPKEIVELIKEN
ncbi:MAG: type II toxin-antitoxin system CcdA family antitoxin, partial [Candidatus Asgardarchaeia archaeon]